MIYLMKLYLINNIFGFIDNSDLNNKIATKPVLKAEREKIVKLQAFDLIFFGDVGFQNMFVYQPTLSALELRKYRTLNMLLVGN